MTIDLKKNNPKPAYHLTLTKVWEVNNTNYHVTTTLGVYGLSDPSNIHFAIYET